MGTISDKLTYLNTTKSQLKDMINYGLDDENKITSSTTFRNYVSSIFNAFLESLNNPSTLFNNLPKITGSGSNITLNDTANAPMRIELGASELTQAGTPTPSSPQEVHTISGDNKVVVSDGNGNSQEADIDLSSKNLISVPEYYPVTAGPVVLDLKTPVPAGTYTISIKEFINGGTTKGLIHFLDSSNTQLTYTALDNSSKSATITVSSPIAKLRFYSQNSASASAGITSTYVGLMLSVSGGEYQEYYEPIEYCKIGNYEDKFIRTSGKNLLDTQYYEQGSIDGSTGQNLGNSKNARGSNYISVLPNTTYTFSTNVSVNDLRLSEYASDNSHIQRDSTSSSSSLTITTTSNTYYVRWSLNYDNSTNMTNSLLESLNPMLNEGTTALDYEPYGSNEWYIKKNIGKVVLDGTQTIASVNTSSTNTTRVSYNGLANGTVGLNAGGSILCNRLVQSNNWSTDTEGISYDASNGALWFRINKTTIGTTEAEVNTYLSSNNIILYLIYINPTYTQITGTLAEQLEYVYQKLLSYSGTTNISQINNDLSFNMNILAIEE